MSEEETPPLFLRNLRAKLIAFLLAVVTWYVVHGAISHEYELVNVPVTVSLTPGWAVLEQSVESVSIRFRGSREDIRELKSDTVQVIMDLRDAEKQGERRITLRPQDVRAPGNARPLSFRPAGMVFTLDEEGEKMVSVKTHLVGELPPGVELTSISAEPVTVLLVGPETLLEDQEEIRTQPLDLTSYKRSFHKQMDLVLPETDGVIRADPGKVTIRIELTERSAELIIDELPVRAMFRPGVSPKVSFDPPSVDVVLVGEPEVLETVQKQALQAYIACSSIDVAAEYELPVKIDTPSRVGVAEIKPAVIRVQIENL